MNLLKHFAADSVRHVQALGLLQGGRFASRMLGERHPSSGDLLPWQIRTLESLQSVICATDADDLPTPDECGALEATLSFLRGMPTPTVERMSALLALFEAAPLAVGPVRVRFSALDQAQQTAFLESWPDSRLPQQRAAFHAIKTMCMMGYWTRPSTWEPIGYDIKSNPGVPDHLKENA